MIADFSAKVQDMTAGEIVNNWYFRQYTTPKVFATLQAMDPNEKPAAVILEKINAKKAREEKKNTARRLEKIEAAENIAAASWAVVNVKFVRSKTWGYNPRVDLNAAGTITTGTASGCGYDKESAAIADAMNANPAIMAIIYDHADKGLSFPYSVGTFAGVPYFDGGCGVSCFRSVFEACGYSWKNTADGKHFSAYTLEKI